MKIRLYKLPGCGYCEQVEGVLKDLNQNNVIVDVTRPEHSSEVSRLEDFFESNRYPKLILEVPGKTIFINPSQEKEITSIGDNEFIFYKSVEDIINTIKKYKNEVQTARGAKTRSSK